MGSEVAGMNVINWAITATEQEASQEELELDVKARCSDDMQSSEELSKMSTHGTVFENLQWLGC